MLAAAFSKKKPQDAPEIPDYDTFVLRYNNKKNNVSDDESEMFRTDAWWKKPRKDNQSHAEVKAGGEKALKHELPEVMNINPIIDEETESMMQQFFYGDRDDADAEIE